MVVLIVVLVALGMIGIVVGLVHVRGNTNSPELTFDMSFERQAPPASQSTRILVGGNEYSRLDDVPDPVIRRQLEHAISEAHRERSPVPATPNPARVMTTTRSETRVMVDGNQYDSIDAVPDPAVRSKLHAAVEAARRGL